MSDEILETSYTVKSPSVETVEIVEIVEVDLADSWASLNTLLAQDLVAFRVSLPYTLMTRDSLTLGLAGSRH